MSDGPESEAEMSAASTLTLPLSPEARVVIGQYLVEGGDLPSSFRAVRELLAGVGVYSSGIEFLRWMLAQDASLRERLVSATESASWTAADRALARIGAAYYRGGEDSARAAWIAWHNDAMPQEREALHSRAFDFPLTPDAGRAE